MQQSQQPVSYDCIVCGAHFETSKQLLKHNETEHLSTAKGMERPRDRDAEIDGRPETD